MTADSLDLGGGYSLRYLRWAPDRALNPQYDGVPDLERYSAVIRHPAGPNLTVPEHFAPTGMCEGGITFAGDVQRQIAPKATTWTVESWEPLTISPSVLCHCGAHGWIRDGKWVPA